MGIEPFHRFKLHLRSKLAPGAGKQVTDDIPALPSGKIVVDVFADFLAYLYECARSYIRDTEPNGALLWDSVEGQIDFVLSHPNGWEGTQQNEMRKAAIQAGLVPDTAPGHARLSFVTEGEASLHYAVQNGLPDAAARVCARYSLSYCLTLLAEYITDRRRCCDRRCWRRNHRR